MFYFIQLVSILTYVQTSSSKLVRLTRSNMNISISLKDKHLYMYKLTHAVAAKHKEASVVYLSAHILHKVTYRNRNPTNSSVHARWDKNLISSLSSHLNYWCLGTSKAATTELHIQSSVGIISIKIHVLNHETTVPQVFLLFSAKYRCLAAKRI